MTISFDTIETEALKLSPVLPTRYERNNRLAAANRAEETRRVTVGAFFVADAAEDVEKSKGVSNVPSLDPGKGPPDAPRSWS